MVPDDAWMTLCSLISPLFKCERLKTPIEEINRLTYIYLKLRKSQAISTQSQMIESLQSPMVGSFNAAGLQSPTSWLTPLSAPNPTFVTSFVQSPTASVHTINSASTKATDEIQDYLKMGMSALMTYLQIDEQTRDVKLNSRVHNPFFKGTPKVAKAAKRPHGNSSASITPTAVPHYFEKCCYVLWVYFYNDVFFYLRGIFLPLEEESIENEMQLHQLSVASPPMSAVTTTTMQQQLNQPPPPMPSAADTTLTPQTMSSPYFAHALRHPNSTLSIGGGGGTGAGGVPGSGQSQFTVRDMILISYRDNVVIPLYEQNRQRESVEREYRRRENTATTTISDNTRFNEFSGDDEYPMYRTLLQCFTVLCGVQTNDTNQKIIETLMRQTKEKCQVMESISKL
ncbi:unnamed protein product [Ambrosiozyma monospora]|uniref:Unnamed protein product n=1 Tax=Ambrosiozyma monospora TaxID=43982 RepID=A0ACB5T9P1_AMBMO|nr:unnamed protein product [Ambrosiozyma monospora]